MARITYGDKSTAQVSPLPEDQKWVSADANEVKESVNALYDINGVLVGVAGAVVDIGEGEVGQVLISSGVGAPPAWLNSGELPVTPFFSLTSGSQSGIYVEDGANSGRAKFSLVGGNPALDLAAWSGSSWNVTVGGVVAYQSSDDVADPTLCTAWTIAGGVAPLPDTSVLYGPVVQETLQQLGQAVTGSAMVVDYQPGPLGIMSGIAIFQGETLGGGVTFDLLTLIPGITGARFISASSPEGTPVFCGLGDGSLDTFIVSVLDISGSPIGDSNLIDVVIAYKL
mgnify:CR=1 FL=1